MSLAACVVEERVPPRPTTPQPPPPGPVVETGVDLFGQPLRPGTTRVALLVPLSGPQADAGTALRNAAELALVDIGSDQIQVVPRDTGSDPQTAAAAAQFAINVQSSLILGPLFGAQVPAVAEVARQAGVNVIAFSNDRNVAGGNAAVLGFLPQPQVDRIIQYAATQGLTDYALFAPNNAFGQLVAQALEAAAARNGGRLAAAQFFNPDTGDYSTDGRALVANSPQVDAVLVMPTSGRDLRHAAAVVRFYGLRSEQLLGTTVWQETPDLNAEPALIGGWYAAPQPDLRANFEASYQQRFGQRPPAIASLAYDAVALAIGLARSGRGDYSWGALTDASGFDGINGIFRFSRSGLVERGLAVLEVTPEGVIVRDPAPSSFAGVAF